MIFLYISESNFVISGNYKVTKTDIIKSDNVTHLNYSSISIPTGMYGIGHNGLFNVTLIPSDNIKFNHKIMVILGLIVILINSVYLYYSKVTFENKFFRLMLFNFVILLIIILCADNIYYDIYKEHLSSTLQWIRG
jgi:hypothetical protein